MSERNEKAFEFAENIPFEELFSYIRRLTGIQELEFNKRIEEDRFGMPRPKFECQDLVDKVGFLKLLFSEITISTFNSEINFNKEINDFSYWGTASFSYKHPNGGSNGHTFLTFWYNNKKGWEWDIR